MRRPAGSGPIVVKVGSSSLTTGGTGLDPEALAGVADHIAALRLSGRPAAIVTSGAVAAGLPALGLPSDPVDGLPYGFQLIGRPFAEPTLLQLGHAYQQVTRFPTRVPELV